MDAKSDRQQPSGPAVAPSGRVALLSVSNKAGIADLGRALVELGFTVLSTGGTARVLEEQGVAVTRVSDFTGAPEIMNGRVKTLHPKVHGGILGDRAKHAGEATEHGISWIDLVAVNLYPFEATVAQGADVDEAIEKIDIGGPTMVRAAAKNHPHVTVLTDPADYDRVIEALRGGGTSLELRRELAVKAFRHTSRYDAVIADWFGRRADGPSFPSETTIGLRRIQELRYGENPHQQAAFYADTAPGGRNLARVVQHQGGPLSFNNLGDLDGALRVVFEYDEPACAIIKHMNPAGCATAPDLPEAFRRALSGDPVSAFGGVVVFNRPVDPDTVRALRKARTFFEILAAPGYQGDALERLVPRKKLRVLELPGDWADSTPPGRDARRVQGGWLIQDWDVGVEPGWEVATERAPTAEESRALRFAWKACRNVKSNAIVFARALEDGALLNGVGAGQMSRVDSVRIALSKATGPTAGCVMASDAFFPFADGIEAAVTGGITAIIQPGGSIRDEEVVAAANAAGVAMVFTGRRHFRH